MVIDQATAVSQYLWHQPRTARVGKSCQDLVESLVGQLMRLLGVAVVAEKVTKAVITMITQRPMVMFRYW